jgi:hypothetical protein
MHDIRELHYDSVDSAYLDCLNDNLAVLLRYLGVADVRTPFACQWHFEVDPARPLDSLSLERTPITTVIRAQTGCAIERVRFEAGDLLAQCAPFIARDEPALVFGDAYAMPWLPYFERAHMEHSFIVDSIAADRQSLHLVDAYENRTEWGAATPTETTIARDVFERAVRELDALNAGYFWIVRRVDQPDALDLPALLRDNAEQIGIQLGERQRLAQFCAWYAERITDLEAMKQFTLDCWLIARTRAYHQLWLADLERTHPKILPPDFAALFGQDVAAPWQRVSEFAYILSRRLSQGRRPPDTCFQMIRDVVQPNELRVADALARSLRPQL